MGTGFGTLITSTSTATAASVIDLARQIINDESATVWTPETLLKRLCDGLERLYARRKGAFMASGVIPALALPTVLTAALQVGPAWIEPLADYVAGRLLIMDGERSDRERGERLIKSFEARL